MYVDSSLEGALVPNRLRTSTLPHPPDYKKPTRVFTLSNFLSLQGRLTSWSSDTAHACSVGQTSPRLFNRPFDPHLLATLFFPPRPRRSHNPPCAIIAS